MSLFLGNFGIKGHCVFNILSNGLEKKYVYICILDDMYMYFYTHGESRCGQMLTLGHLEMKNLGEACTRFFVLFLQCFRKSGIMSE